MRLLPDGPPLGGVQSEGGVQPSGGVPPDPFYQRLNQLLMSKLPLYLRIKGKL